MKPDGEQGIRHDTASDVSGAAEFVARPKVLAARTLRGLTGLPATPLGWGTRSLAELGTSAFAAQMLAAAAGDPFDQSTPASAEDDLKELIEAAGASHDPGEWVFVDDPSGRVGVVLPHADPDGRGTLFYLGVVPERRGEGLGRALHAYGLRALRRRGATRYEGSTDERNAPMLAIFCHNECRITSL